MNTSEPKFSHIWKLTEGDVNLDVNLITAAQGVLPLGFSAFHKLIPDGEERKVSDLKWLSNSDLLLPPSSLSLSLSRLLSLIYFMKNFSQSNIHRRCCVWNHPSKMSTGFPIFSFGDHCHFSAFSTEKSSQ